jgi:hypothetical protein
MIGPEGEGVDAGAWEVIAVGAEVSVGVEGGVDSGVVLAGDNPAQPHKETTISTIIRLSKFDRVF